jgi:hypothetical protein
VIKVAQSVNQLVYYESYITTSFLKNSPNIWATYVILKKAQSEKIVRKLAQSGHPVVEPQNIHFQTAKNVVLRNRLDQVD